MSIPPRASKFASILSAVRLDSTGTYKFAPFLLGGKRLLVFVGQVVGNVKDRNCGGQVSTAYNPFGSCRLNRVFRYDPLQNEILWIDGAVAKERYCTLFAVTHNEVSQATVSCYRVICAAISLFLLASCRLTVTSCCQCIGRSTS
jgi:hypothetical protein